MGVSHCSFDSSETLSALYTPKTQPLHCNAPIAPATTTPLSPLPTPTTSQPLLPFPSLLSWFFPEQVSLLCLSFSCLCIYRPFFPLFFFSIAIECCLSPHCPSPLSLHRPLSNPVTLGPNCEIVLNKSIYKYFSSALSFVVSILFLVSCRVRGILLWHSAVFYFMIFFYVAIIIISFFIVIIHDGGQGDSCFLLLLSIEECCSAPRSSWAALAGPQ